MLGSILWLLLLLCGIDLKLNVGVSLRKIGRVNRIIENVYGMQRKKKATGYEEDQLRDQLSKYL